MAKRNLPLGGATPMEPGERDRLVVIEQLSASKGGTGYPKETWVTLTSAYMSVLDVKAWERFKASQNAPAVETRFEMGYRDDMDPERVDVPTRRRLVYQSRTYEITAASMIGRREGIELLTIAPTKVPS
jgi:head-tail adaptor